MHKVITIYIPSQREKRKGEKGMDEVEKLPFPGGNGEGENSERGNE